MSSPALTSSVNFFLDGNFSPVAEEREASDMPVKGQIPKDLAGHFLRIGPNPAHIFNEAAYHTFDGDGMIHAIEFAEGTAHYRNRFVQTEGFKLEQERGDWIYKGMNSMMTRRPRGSSTARQAARTWRKPRLRFTTTRYMRCMSHPSPRWCASPI